MYHYLDGGNVLSYEEEEKCRKVRRIAFVVYRAGIALWRKARARKCITLSEMDLVSSHSEMFLAAIIACWGETMWE